MAPDPILAYIPLVMTTRLPRSAALLAALTLAALPALAGDPPKTLATQPPAAPTHGFLRAFLAPRMAVFMQHDGAAAQEYASPVANPWTKDPELVDRMERNAIRATKSALKRYAVDALGLDTWSIPLSGGRGGVGRPGAGPSGPGLRFGFSHLTPRAELALPVAAGRVAISADVRGRVGASFRTSASDLRVGAAVDPVDHRATFDLTLRF